MLGQDNIGRKGMGIGIIMKDTGPQVSFVV